MTHIIGAPCLLEKNQGCVAVCPVDCIHDVGRMLVIDNTVCIDCGACVFECPVEAIHPEELAPEGWSSWVSINALFATGGIDAVNDALDAELEARSG